MSSREAVQASETPPGHRSRKWNFAVNPLSGNPSFRPSKPPEAIQAPRMHPGYQPRKWRFATLRPPSPLPPHPRSPLVQLAPCFMEAGQNPGGIQTGDGRNFASPSTTSRKTRAASFQCPCRCLSSPPLPLSSMLKEKLCRALAKFTCVKRTPRGRMTPTTDPSTLSWGVWGYRQ